jgi:hypothetical protein
MVPDGSGGNAHPMASVSALCALRNSLNFPTTFSPCSGGRTRRFSLPGLALVRGARTVGGMWRKPSREREYTPQPMTEPLPLDGLPRRKPSNGVVAPTDADVVSIVRRVEEPFGEQDVDALEVPRLAPARRRTNGIAD